MAWSAKMIFRACKIYIFQFAIAAFLMLSAQLSMAQDSLLLMPSHSPQEQAWSDQEWEQLQKQIDFGEKPEEKPEGEQKKKGDSSRKSEDQSAEGSFFSGKFGKGIAYVLLGCMLVILCVVLYRSQWKNADSKVEITLVKLENEDHVDVIETEFELLLRQALIENNYRLAVRLLFLNTLKQLNQKNLIKWQKHKTNRQYAMELGALASKENFNQLLWVYEIVWYGERVTNLSDYTQIKGLFDQYQFQLNEQK